MQTAVVKQRARQCRLVLSVLFTVMATVLHSSFRAVHVARLGRTGHERRTAYTCGHDVTIFVRTILPDYESSPLRLGLKVVTTDVLAVGMHAPCPGVEDFPGLIFYLNGESVIANMVEHARYLGPVHTVDPAHMQFYYASYAALALHALHALRNRPQPSKDRFLLYVQSNCVPDREAAFKMFASLGEVSAAGKCHGGIEKYERVVRAGDWTKDLDIYRGFKFGLVMENAHVKGYVTEKIVAAFAGGTVPIYSGTEEVFNIFNKDAFIFFDRENPERTKNRVRALLKNETAYRVMLSQPVTRNAQFEKYFSLEKGGALYHEIRAFLRVDHNE